MSPSGRAAKDPPAARPVPFPDAAAPVYTVGQVADMLEVQPAFLRRLDTEHVVMPSRSQGGQRRYSRTDIDRIHAVTGLLAEGLTLAGVLRIIELQAENAELRRQLADRAEKSDNELRPALDDHRPRFSAAVCAHGAHAAAEIAGVHQRVRGIMPERWFRQAVIYCVDVDTYQDSDGDGIGDLPGLIDRLDHLARLGVTCIWLNPIHPSPDRDDGYDITDFYAVHPHLGTLGDFVELIHQADNRGIRVMIDLVVNHTSDEHPWFQSARSDPDSPYRDWYVWSKDEPADLRQGMVFPGYQDTTWTFDEEAGEWYYHRFYDFQPDLNMSNPRVRQEIEKIIGFWLQIGVKGFRLDAAPFIIELTAPNDPSPRKDFSWLNDFREQLAWRRGDAVILAEANVEPEELIEYFGDGHRLPMLFNFILNQRTFLALARQEVGPILQALAETPALPESCQWATFLRNHDEVDLGRLVGHEHDEVFAAFGPDPNMQLYERGIRRRLAPMLGNDRRRIEMTYALQFSLPGTPVIRYGDEIGMGEDLRLRERNAVRTPMQWSNSLHGGFSTSKRKRDLRRPVITGGEFGYEKVNVENQQRDPGSLLAWFQRALLILRECPEFGVGSCTYVDAGERSVLALVHEAPSGAMLAVINLAKKSFTVDLGPHRSQEGDPIEVFADRDYHPVGADLSDIEVGPYGYRWIRLRRTIGARAGSTDQRRA